jgi:hypothetical protein
MAPSDTPAAPSQPPAIPVVRLFGDERFSGWEVSSNPLQSVGLYAAQLLAANTIYNYSCDQSCLIAPYSDPPTISAALGSGTGGYADIGITAR